MQRLSETQTASEADKKLKRELSFRDLYFLSMGGIIGSGWLFAVLGASAAAGPSVILAWVIGGVLLIFVALTYAEVSGMIPKSGAIVRYPHYSHGSYTGFILGWAYLLTAVTVPAIEAEAVVGYAATYVPSLNYVSSGVTLLSSTGIGLALVLTVIFFLVNIAGIRILGKANTYVTVWKFVIPTLTFILLFAAFHSSNLTSYGGFFPLGVAPMFLAIPGTGIVFAYLGFRQALEYAGEGKNPQKDVPRALILSVITAMGLYALLQLTFIGAINWSAAGITPGNWAGLATSSWASGPLYQALTSSGIAALGAFGVILLIDAYVSPSGTGWIYMGTSTRTFFGLATDGYFPKLFLKVNEKTGVPIMALIASVILGVLFLLPFPSWYLLVGFISSGTVFTYIMGGVVLQVFRKTAPEMKRPYRLPAASVIAPIAFVAASLITYWSGFNLLFYVFTAIFAGIPLYYMFYAPQGLGISRGAGTAAGIVFWILLGGLTYLGYTSIVSVSSSASTSALNTSFFEYYGGMAVMLIVFTALLQVLAKPEFKKGVKSGWWLILYALAILPVSFYGGFGDVVKVSFPYDNVVMIIVAGIFYAFAVLSGYKTESIDHLQDEVGLYPAGAGGPAAPVVTAASSGAQPVRAEANEKS